MSEYQYYASQAIDRPEHRRDEAFAGYFQSSRDHSGELYQ